MPLAILTSHPIQYYAPLFREISRRISTKVFRTSCDTNAAGSLPLYFEGGHVASLG
jgi:hypothetical protein